MRVALYGGSFDPPHIGHVMGIAQALCAGFDAVWAIPTASHPFAKTLSPFEHRFAMCQAAFSIFGSGVRVDPLESERSEISRTFDTVVELQARHPGMDFTWIIGADNVDTLDKWYRIDDLRARIPFLVLGRGDRPGTAGAPPIPDVSSSSVRAIRRGGGDVRHLVPATVMEYINREALYPRAPAINWALIGAGKVGLSLARSLAHVGNPPRWIHDREASARAVARRDFSILDGVPLEADLENLEVLVMAVSDNAGFPLPNLPRSSGFPSCILSTGGMHAPPEDSAQRTHGVIHPALAVPDGTMDLTSRHWAICGSARSMSMAEHLLAPLEPLLHPLPPDTLTFYHALAALLANGGAFILERAAEVLADKTQTAPPALRPLLGQLARSGLEALLDGDGGGFTGPLVRGDLPLVRDHVRALLDSDRDLATAYEACIKIGATLLGVDLESGTEK